VDPEIAQEFLDDERFATLAEAAFSASPLGDVGGGRAAIAMYEYFRSRPGANGVVARVDGDVAGFAYGYPDFRWADHTSDWDDLLREAIGDRHEQLEGAYTVMFLAVSPDFQGEGLGRALLRAVVPTDAPAAWLATRDAVTAAQGLYASEGWREIGRGPLAGPGERSAVLWKPLLDH
jgi:ribosomal protein S18 acetylase RimI-like enzyme